MRTLLVDNYDSFTHNLAHYLAEVTGCAPVVLRNDDPLLSPALLTEFDNVVLSPGPGTPEQDTDLGRCLELLDRCELPLLGVCLGHQAIAHAFGAKVARAPQPRHGRTSPVLHEGEGLFAGLPSPFEAVRYHSLAVTDLPEQIEPTAWTPDGVLMGLRHRDRPLWGVQFHPESIRTEHGHALLRNFTELRPHGARRPVISTSGANPSGGKPSRSRRCRVHVRELATDWHEEVAFDRLFRPSRYAFWLDSGDRDRFSIMGDARSAVRAQDVPGGFFDWLDGELRQVEVDVPELPFEFALGWVGYLGYELKAECGGERAHTSPYPDAVLAFAERALVFDHLEHRTYLLALDQTWLDEAETALIGLSDVDPIYHGRPQGPSRVHLRHGRNRYLESIAACQDAIAAGETYEVNLTNALRARGDLDPWQAYQFLRRNNSTPFGALLQLDELSVLSTSPERFLRVDRHGAVESKPIKGTRPRGDTPEQDELLREQLRTSEKDRSESLMIVDLVRNDLARCAEIGSVHVPGLFQVESYPTVHQLVATVRAQLRADASAVDCVRAAFPGGSMTGAPKIRTMRLIDQLEGAARGVYSGAIGYFSLTGAADLSIVIRTAVITPGLVDYGVGGAVVALSDAEAEYEETAVKAAPLLDLLGAEFPDRVM
ncbi:aminodeoxychorismate synthase component I [Kutzneria viridogrisea]|uniref:aminodeoxychorismate synthase n=1 Tax=Kutzneria viridogrisea TaxID=47990 RepID=A0ABR6BI52_9PSEU|nr:para-aminobenzoate synthetase [Kutzneria viridogrisea]